MDIVCITGGMERTSGKGILEVVLHHQEHGVQQARNPQRDRLLLRITMGGDIPKNVLLLPDQNAQGNTPFQA